MDKNLFEQLQILLDRSGWTINITFKQTGEILVSLQAGERPGKLMYFPIIFSGTADVFDERLISAIIAELNNYDQLT